MPESTRLRIGAIALTALAWSAGLHAGQPLETETARPLPKGTFKLDLVSEFQTSSEGKEIDVPLALEYGITDKLELLVEPVLYTSIRPKGGASTTGLGDLEVTLSYVVQRETRWLPAIALAGEVKVPTAKDTQIGTGKTDYTPFAAASKRFGQFDLHLNFGYTFVGQPVGPRLDNTFNYALAGEYHANPTWDFVAEVLGNTSSLKGAGVENPVTPEAAGGEVVGMVGARYFIQPTTFFSVGLSYDNNNAFLVRTGLTFRFR